MLLCVIRIAKFWDRHGLVVKTAVPALARCCRKRQCLCVPAVIGGTGLQTIAVFRGSAEALPLHATHVLAACREISPVASPGIIACWSASSEEFLQMCARTASHCATTQTFAACSRTAIATMSCMCNTRSCAINHLLRGFPHSRARSRHISEQVPGSALRNYGEVPEGGVTLVAWSCLFMLADSEV